jgi:hypothetical protein
MMQPYGSETSIVTVTSFSEQYGNFSFGFWLQLDARAMQIPPGTIFSGRGNQGATLNVAVTAGNASELFEPNIMAVPPQRLFITLWVGPSSQPAGLIVQAEMNGNDDQSVWRHWCVSEPLGRALTPPDSCCLLDAGRSRTRWAQRAPRALSSRMACRWHRARSAPCRMLWCVLCCLRDRVCACV